MSCCVNRSFKQLKDAQRDYQDWGNFLGGICDLMDNNLASKKTSFSMQGFEAKPDFPKLEIQVPDDRCEMETSDTKW